MRAKIIDLKKYKTAKEEEYEEIEPVTIKIGKQDDKAIITLSTKTNWFRINEENFELLVNQIRKTMNWKS
jgi:hypothetical protein